MLTLLCLSAESCVASAPEKNSKAQMNRVQHDVSIVNDMCCPGDERQNDHDWDVVRSGQLFFVVKKSAFPRYS